MARPVDFSAIANPFSGNANSMNKHDSELDTLQNEAEEAVDEIQEQTEQAVEEHPWIRRWVRFGIATRGIIYFTIGLLAIEAAVGWGGETTDSSGALWAIVQQPLGKLLISILTAGLVGYAVWRFVLIILGPEHENPQTSGGILQYGNWLVDGLSYAGLAFTGVQILLGFGNPDQDSNKLWAAIALQQPLGRWLLLGVGLWTIGIGFSYLYSAYTKGFVGEFQSEQLEPQTEYWITQIGRFGVVARGVVFVIVGGLLTKAAWFSDPDQATGEGGALAALMSPPMGSWLLATVASGFMAYAIYSLIAAWYRRLETLS